MQPSVVRTAAELDDALMPSRLATSPVAYVPTMGALHEGHATLLRVARRLGDVLVASIFVNPTQFAPGEDLQTYPRTPEADLDVCSRENVDIVFMPQVATIYPEGMGRTTVDPGLLGTVLEGRTRPNHFRGVLTVLAKFFAIIRPSHVVLGEKDYQQLVLVTNMVKDLCLPIEVVRVPTVRELDGLAMSSRNSYLRPRHRAAAVSLSRALSAGAAVAAQGPDAVLHAARRAVDEAEGVAVDYVALTDPELGLPPVSGEARLLLAARFGATRLIDNCAVVLGRPAGL